MERGSVRYPDYVQAGGGSQGRGGYQSGRHGSGGYRPAPQGTADHQAFPQGTGGYQAVAQATGGYQAVPQGTGGYQAGRRGKGARQGGGQGTGVHQAGQYGPGGYQAGGQGSGGYRPDLYAMTMTEPSHDEQTWALMAYLGQFFALFAAPAAVLLFKGRTAFVRRHAAQALNLSIAMTVVWVIGGLLALNAATWFVWIPLTYGLLCTIFLIRGAMAANRMDFTRIPALFAWPIIKSH